MATFFAYSGLLLFLSLLFVVWPVLRYKPQAKAGDNTIRRQKNIQVYEQSLADLEGDLAEGLITIGECDKLKIELQRSFLRDMQDADWREHANLQGSKLLPLLSLLFIPVFSYSLYEVIGSARDLALPGILEELRTVETPEAQEVALLRLAEFLQDRYQRKSDDIQNGYMLGTLYLELENYPAAISTFTGLADGMDEGMDKATVLGQLAQSMFLAADSVMTPSIRSVIDQALALNPNEYAVMSLLAMEALINEDVLTALGYWRRQLLQLGAGSREAAVLRDRIARVEALLPPSERPSEDEPGASVTLVIDIDDSVKNLANDSMRLFVYARNPAMPMPLAVQNLALPDFPITVTLDDSMAMLENMALSSSPNVIVGARLSRSGQATAQSGDIQAVSEPFVLSEQDGPVLLTIRDIVP
jgi:cytochrome c-type biogenesis protein CcmH